METLTHPTLESEKMYGIQTEIICIDLAGNLQLNRLYEEIMKRQKSSTLINIASADSFISPPIFRYLYCYQGIYTVVYRKHRL